MSGLELAEFSLEHVEPAAELLAERHRRHRAAEPLLPRRFEDGGAARREIERAWRKDGSVGVVALRDSRLVGYLIGAPDDDALWGPNEWIELAGLAVKEAEVARDLYAAFADRALAAGRGRHYVLVPASDVDLLDAWYRLGFGQQQAYGIREVPAEPWPAGVREAELDDLVAVLELAPLLSRHHAASPVFSEQAVRRAAEPQRAIDEAREEIESDVASGEIGTLLAEADGRIVGFFEIAPVELAGDSVSGHGTFARPDHACFLAFAVTVPAARGSGAGVRLTNGAFAWAHRAGYPVMVTDWRVTNLLSSRFWPRRGFRPTFLRLYRSIP